MEVFNKILEIFLLGVIGGAVPGPMLTAVFTLAKIFMLTILNGGFWIFWLTVCVPRAFSLDELIFGGRFIFLLVFELGWLLMTAGLGYIFSRFRPILLKQNLVATVFKIFATLLVLFALRSVYDSIIFIIN